MKHLRLLQLNFNDAVQFNFEKTIYIYILHLNGGPEDFFKKYLDLYSNFEDFKFLLDVFRK